MKERKRHYWSPKTLQKREKKERKAVCRTAKMSDNFKSTYGSSWFTSGKLGRQDPKCLGR